MSKRLEKGIKNRTNRLKRSIKLLTISKAGIIGLVILLFFILLAVVGPYIWPPDTTPHPNQMYLPPSWKHPLGTDSNGRDIWSEIVNGSESILYVALLAATVTVGLAAVLGAVAGFKGGMIDSAIASTIDIILTIPQFPLMAVLSGIIQLDDTSLALLIGILSWPGLARAIRSQVLSLRERDFIEAAKALDLGTNHIVFTELMPNLAPYIAVNFAFAMIGAIYTQVGLVFLGLVPFQSFNWGVMINLAWNRGAIYYAGSISYILSPILAIVLLETGAILLSRGTEIIFNPRLREEE